jgi:hypothetical protein
LLKSVGFLSPGGNFVCYFSPSSFDHNYLFYIFTLIDVFSSFVEMSFLQHTALIVVLNFKITSSDLSASKATKRICQQWKLLYILTESQQ